MTRNPFINAIVAIIYIIIVSVVMFYGTGNLPREDTVFAPIAALSVFTLSAAVMGYIFCYEPFLSLLAGRRKEAAELFLKTVGAFGITTAAILFLYFSGIIH